MNVCETIKQLNSEKTDAFMHELYGKGAPVVYPIILFFSIVYN